jgi:hypothetical protein
MIPPIVFSVLASPVAAIRFGGCFLSLRLQLRESFYAGDSLQPGHQFTPLGLLTATVEPTVAESTENRNRRHCWLARSQLERLIYRSSLTEQYLQNDRCC